MKYYLNYHIPPNWGWGHEWEINVSEQTETHITGELDWSSSLWQEPLCKLVHSQVSMSVKDFTETERGEGWIRGYIDEALIKAVI